jgi:hypothetical protein
LTISELSSAVPGEKILDLARLERMLPKLHQEYVTACPFPHIVFDDFLEPGVAEQAASEFPEVDDPSWMKLFHLNERKCANPNFDTWGPTLRAVATELNSPSFVRFLTNLTGIDDLFQDEALEGGGLHQSLAGGFLNVHADFTVHPLHQDWRRRVNLLLYLNTEWHEEYGGGLELWSTDMKRCERRILPVGNRAVIFTTDADSFHGHPEPMRCPEGVARRSLALYYFTVEDHPFVRSTEYRARPGDGLKSVLIYLDKQAVRLYDRAKRRLGISDQRINDTLKMLGSMRRRRPH